MPTKKHDGPTLDIRGKSFPIAADEVPGLLLRKLAASSDDGDAFLGMLQKFDEAAFDEGTFAELEEFLMNERPVIGVEEMVEAYGEAVTAIMDFHSAAA